MVGLRVLAAGLTFAISLVGSACSSKQTTATPVERPAISISTTAAYRQPSASAIAEHLRSQIAAITKVVTITENNDPNNLIGRPTGYVDAAVAYDSATICLDLGSDCGAMVEVWPTPEAAQQRANYIAALQQASPILGTEYHHLRGPVLLRVTGDIKPSVNAEYATAFAESGV